MMFCSNQELLVNGDTEEALSLTLAFAMNLSGFSNTAERRRCGSKPQPAAYTMDPVRGVILYWHEDVPGVTAIPEPMRNEKSIVTMIQDYLSSDEAVAARYRELKIGMSVGDSWLRNGWECYIPTSKYQDPEYGLDTDQGLYAIVGFRPALTRYDK